LSPVNEPAAVRLSFACGDYDRVRALRDGRVRAEGIELVFLPLGPEEIFFRQLVYQEFDVSEMSLGSYVASIAHGDGGLVAIPVFPSRAFRHSAAYVHTGAGISCPEDLRGKRVGVAEYALTANVWLRGILEDEHGVHPRDVRWFQGGLDDPGRREKSRLPLATDVRIEELPEGETLTTMLVRGDLDAIFSPRLPRPFVQGSPAVVRLFPDYRRIEADYYRRTRIFPIMHTVVIRRDVYERDRWIAQSLTKALAQAKAACLDAIYTTAAFPYALPWMHEEVETVRALIGPDWWPYGIAANRPTLETFLRYAEAQGITGRHVAVEELFAPETLETFRI